MKAEIGNRLRGLRESLNLRQKDVADVLNLTQAAYGKIETGMRDLSTEYIIKLADYYGVTCDYLLRGSRIEEAMNEMREKELRDDLARVDKQIAEATEEAKRMCESWGGLQSIVGQAQFLRELYRRRALLLRQLGAETREDVHPSFRSAYR